MSEISAKSFLDLLNQSGIVAPEEMRPALAKLKEKAGGKPVNLDSLTKHLIDEGLITEWHVQKLINGKYRGYYLGKYKLMRHLGTGGMSTVYLAQHTIFKQQRAIKVLPKKRIDDKSYLDRFYREGRAAASLNHKNIVRVYDIDNDGNTHYLVMEFVNGSDIYERVKKDGPLDFRTAVDFTIQSLIGLQHAHQNNLVHRDIKPANLLVTPDGVVKILDLGLALFREDDTSLTVMHNEKVLGTADYLSPEQAVDSHNLDHRADVYSLGCTLFYMLTGKPPFYDGTIAQRIAMHQTKMPESIKNLRPECPDVIEKICFKMMAKKPDDRYQSCSELVTILRGVLEDLPEGTAEVSRTDAAAKSPTVGPVIDTRSGKSSVRKQSPAPRGQKVETTSAPKTPTPKTPAPKSSTPQPAAARNPNTAAKSAKPSGRQAAPAAQQQASQTAKPNSATQASTTKTAETAAAKPQSAPARKTAQPSAVPQQTRPKPAPATDARNAPAQSPRGQRRGTTQPVSADAKRQTAMPPPDAKTVQRNTNSPGVSVVTKEPRQSSIVGAPELKNFAKQHVSSPKKTAIRRKGITKEQWIVTGIVIGMVILLATVLGVAMRLTNRDEPEKESRVGPSIPAAVAFESKPWPASG